MSSEEEEQVKREEEEYHEDDVEIVMEEEVDSASENSPDVQEPAGGQIRVRLSMGNHE